MKNKNEKIEYVNYKFNGNAIVKIKKDNQFYEAQNSNLRKTIVDAVKKATGIEGSIEEIKMGMNKTSVKINFCNKTIESEFESSDPVYSFFRAYIDAYNQFAESN